MELWTGKGRVILGGFLLHLVMGNVYTWGNLTVYVSSYLRTFDDTITYEDTILIYATIILGQALLMFLGGKWELRVGPRAAAATGSLFLVLAPLLASRAESNWAMVLGFGLCFGFGGGLTYMVPVVCGYRWDPQNKGFVSGAILAGFGASALIFNQVQTLLVNPDNLKPDVTYKGKHYFSKGPVTDAVPGMFLKLALIWACLAFVGVALLEDPAYKKIEDRRRQRRQHRGGGSRLAAAAAAGPGGGSGESSPQSLRRRLYEDEDQEEEEDEEDGFAEREAAAAAAAGEDGGVGASGVGEQYLQDGVEGDADDDEEDEEEDEEGLTPGELLRTPRAYHVSASFMLGALGGLVTLASYKALALGNVTGADDHFLGMAVGSLSSISNSLGRVFWGGLSDRVGAYRALYSLCLLLAAAMFSWGLTVDPWDSRWAFALWVVVICFCHGGNFAVYPSLTARLFGRNTAGPNFGLVFLGYGVCSLVGLAVLPRLSKQLSPLNYFLGTIALAAAASVASLERCYKRKRETRTGAGGGGGRRAGAGAGVGGLAQAGGKKTAAAAGYGGATSFN